MTDEAGLRAAYEAVDRLPLRNFDDPGGELDTLRRHEGARAAIIAYLSALTAAGKGVPVVDWQEWNGGQCPVVPASVTIRLRNGEEKTVYAHSVNWERRMTPFDVVAWRPALSRPKP
jgi:hypothetical protein